ncbi:MAG: dihydrodipicolinate synthase family protein [Betaproteobacteria bacterium]|nr:dihydrodipicolinate synthase family protein [Betaproteobacteria bacterium]
MSEPRRFSGVYPILYAFYDDRGAIDEAAMRLQVERCIVAGAHGIAVLGLVTEVHKLDVEERRQVVDIVGAAIAGRVPFAVTIGEPSIAGQIAFARHAQAAGAAWVILQTPAKGYAEGEYVRFRGRVADALDLPVAIQNNPVNLDVALSNASLLALHRQHRNITLLKGEGPAVQVAALIGEAGGGIDVFAGHGGKEFLSNLRSGCAGLIPAPDCLDVQLRIYDLVRSGRDAEAEVLHASILPLIVFMTSSVPLLLCYGKRLIARRLGIETIHERAPELQPTPFGLAEVDRMARVLGPL